MALTILLTSTGSSAPLRLRTRMPPDTGAALPAAGVFEVSVSVGAAGAARCSDSRSAPFAEPSIVSVSGPPTLPSMSVTTCSQSLVRSFVLDARIRRSCPFVFAVSRSATTTSCGRTRSPPPHLVVTGP